ncbi:MULTISPECIES: glycosyltransferase [unclassified Pseudoalteromonas]|uniref:glycosyltransferase n=1 Tax=unclassified Pseudoalteromonas TaxID=194690 RepID=UPI002873ECE4|nr:MULTISPECIES: glycosyltransferase [unclassified Pseudoalteromonas]
MANRLKLRLVRGGPKLDKLKLLAKKEGFDKLTKFVGPVEHSKVIEVLLKLDVYVTLSRLDSESFGIAIIEAGKAAKPVVVSDVGAYLRL